MKPPISGVSDAQLERLIAALDSLVDGEAAAARLVACGERAVPYLERYLLAGPPRTIALPRCRAVQALGELGAYSSLIAYFEEYERPGDAAVLFAEDAVRSAAARELARWKTEEVFRTLADAAKQRATGGITFALGEFRRAEALPQLFDLLEDDLCREEAKDAIRKLPEEARQYAILSIRGATALQLTGPAALRRLRATLQLLDEFGVSPADWPDLRGFLFDVDADVVIAAASIGSHLPEAADQREIVRSLFRISEHLNWAQEDQVDRLLGANRELAREIANAIVEERTRHGEHPDWLSPGWRILRRAAGRELDGSHFTSA